MRRFIVFSLAFVLVFSSTSFAAKGDIIHTGLKKIYRAGTDEMGSLVDDIVAYGSETGFLDKFYRELDSGKYVNVVKEEKAHLEHLGDLIRANNIKSEDELKTYMADNGGAIDTKFNELTFELTKNFSDIGGGSIDQYTYSSAPVKLSVGNYSTPEPGSMAGTTKISTLNLPTGAYRWQYKIVDDETSIGNIKKGNSVDGGTDYIRERDIAIEADKYIELYALDRNNRVIGFACFKVSASMIRKPTIYASELDSSQYTGPEAGDTDSTTKFSGLDFGALDADKWYVFSSKVGIARPELDSIPLGKEYTVDSSIPAAVGDRLLLLAVKDNKVKAYKIFTLTAEQIKPITPVDENKAMVLRQGTHFTPPVKGSDVGKMKFVTLNPANLEGSIVWRYAVSDKTITAPDLDSMMEGSAKFLANEAMVTNEAEILSKGTVNKNFILLATIGEDDNYKIKGYALLKANESNVRLPVVKKDWNELFSDPKKGTSPFSTKVELLKSDGILGFNHWRYRLVKGDVEDLEFNSVFANSNYYTPNTNISNAAVDHNLVIAGTDSSSRVKVYGVFKLTEGMVRGEDASPLILGTNYFVGNPMAGTDEGSTKFSTLSFSSNITGATKWMVAKGPSGFGSIEKDTVIDGAVEYIPPNDITGVNVNEYLLLLATDAGGKVKGYGEFRLTEGNVRGGVAVKLEEGKEAGKNYTIERGTAPGTTRLSNLKFDGVYGGTSWRVKVLDKALTEAEKPYFNQVVDGANPYYLYNGMGSDIKVSWVSDADKYGYILLLATDGGGKTKAYGVIPVDSSMVKEHAPELVGISLEKGATADKVIFTGLESGKTYKYLLDTREYPTPAKEDLLNGGKDYTGDITVRIGQHLTLFEVIDNKIQAFKRFVIRADNIKQGSAVITTITVAEGSIVNGGTKIEIMLTDAKWLDIENDKSLRDKLFNGFKSNNQNPQWFNVITALIADGGGISVNEDRDTLTLYLAKTPSYDIVEDQIVSLEIPPEVIGAVNPIKATGSMTIKPTIRATIGGDVVSKVIREDDIKNGGVKIVVNLLDGNWVGDINKDTLIGGFSGGANWEKIANEFKSTGTLTRNSSKEVTLTLPKVSGVDFDGGKEDISLNIPYGLLSGATIDVVASPVFSIYPNVLKVAGNPVVGKDTVTMQATDGKDILAGHDTWEVKLTSGTLRPDLTDKDIVLSNLPAGLKFSLERIDDSSIRIKLTGSSTTILSGEKNVSLRIKGSAVVEPNSLDSNDMNLKIKVNEALGFDGVSYEIKDDEIYLVVPTGRENGVYQYSTNSTNGVNGTWNDVTTNSQLISSLVPVKVFVKEKLQPKVFKEAFDLKYAPTPEGVSVEGIDYVPKGAKIVKEVTLSGASTAMEYSLDGGSNWNKIVAPTDPIDLGSLSDLRVRVAPVSGTTGQLPSLSTKRLNGLFLGDVKLQVGAGKLAGTNTTMQYSLNSTNGIDGTWKPGKANETIETFGVGNRVWVREGTSKVNFRELGEVKAKSVPALGGKVTYSIVDGKITNSYADGPLEYKFAGGSWSDLKEGDNTVVFASGNLEIRTKGDNDTLPSTSVVLGTIPISLDPPELKGDDNSKDIYYMASVWTLLDNTFEYKIGSNGSWKSGEEFRDDSNREETIVVYVRKKATVDRLPSKEVSIAFTKNLVLNNVITLNVAGKVLNGTTSKMEYSVNSSKVNNGVWTRAGDGKTTIEPFEGMYLWIREIGKPSTEILFIDNLKRQSLNVNDVSDGAQVYYNVATGKIANYSNRNLEYRVGGGGWSRVDAGIDVYNVGFVAGKLEFRMRATETMMESHPVTKATIMAKASPPNVVFDDVGNKVTSINGKATASEWRILEYRINPSSSSPWIAGELLAAEDLSGDKTVQIRIKATRTELPSQEKEITFIKNADLESVTFSKYAVPLELNGTTKDMEYRVNDGIWQKCIDGNTKLKRNDGVTDLNVLGDVYKLELRDGRTGQQTNQITVYPK